MDRRIGFIFIFVLLVSIQTASAQKTVIQTEMELSENEEYIAILGVEDGSINITVSSTPAIINVSIIQDSNTLVSFRAGPNNSPLSQSIEVAEGKIAVQAFIVGISFSSDITISIFQEQNGIDGLLLAGGIFLIIMIPVVYFIGRYQAKQ